MARRSGGADEEHILGLFYDRKNGYLALLATAFIDESADATHEIAFAAAAYVAPDPVWKGFKPAWKKQLHKSNIKYFKNSECMGLSGEFEWIKAKYNNLDAAKAAGLKIRDKFEKVIQAAKGAFVVAVAMDMKAFKDLNSELGVRRNQNWESDYMVSTYQMTIGFTLETVRQLENEGTQRFIVSFVCDDGPQKKKLEQAYDAFKLRFPEWMPYMGGISHLNDKKVAGLQAADLMRRRHGNCPKTGSQTLQG